MQAPLTNHFLIAMPSMADPNFERAVVYVCDEQDEGTVGIVINRPMNYPIVNVFEQLDIIPQSEKSRSLPLMFGGPVQQERGFVIHNPAGKWQSSLSLNERVTITTSNDIIRAIAIDKGPDDVLIALGYAGWENEQLNQEIVEDNSWLVCPFKSELLYEVPIEQRWQYAGSIIGVKQMSDLSNNIGHA